MSFQALPKCPRIHIPTSSEDAKLLIIPVCKLADLKTGCLQFEVTEITGYLSICQIVGNCRYGKNDKSDRGGSARIAGRHGRSLPGCGSFPRRANGGY